MNNDLQHNIIHYLYVRMIISKRLAVKYGLIIMIYRFERKCNYYQCLIISCIYGVSMLSNRPKSNFVSNKKLAQTKIKPQYKYSQSKIET